MWETNLKMLSTMREQFVTDHNGNKVAVILPIKEYNKMLDDLEELEDIKLFDAAKKGEQEFIDVEQAFREIEERREHNQK
jgi:PHD/YefM family antitoxin component YafN of YafNO toxin-antitoxin module